MQHEYKHHQKYSDEQQGNLDLNNTFSSIVLFVQDLAKSVKRRQDILLQVGKHGSSKTSAAQPVVHRY